jgi:hypothetical protein
VRACKAQLPPRFCRRQRASLDFSNAGSFGSAKATVAGGFYLLGVLVRARLSAFTGDSRSARLVLVIILAYMPVVARVGVWGSGDPVAAFDYKPPRMLVELQLRASCFYTNHEDHWLFRVGRFPNWRE